jgi:two-component system phosphate regulon sensor histidine kinase PhoR
MIERLERSVAEGEIVRQEALATLAHEIKTPLTSIRGYARLMVEGSAGPITTEQADYLSVIQQSVQRMVELSDEVLAVEGSPSSGGANVPNQSFPLTELLDELERTARLICPPSLEFEVSKDPRCSQVSLRLNRVQVAQALLNLLTNAFKYTEQGKVSLKVELESLESDSSRLKIRVRDTGVGIPRAEQSRVFERFYRAEQARVSGVPGRGIGLSVTRRWVESNQGWISLWSEPGVGSEFMVELPCEIPSGIS